LNRKDHLSDKCYNATEAVTERSELKGNQLQIAEHFVLGTISSHVFSHPEESKLLPQTMNRSEEQAELGAGGGKRL